VVGTKLIREWDGVEHTVTVLKDGFDWQGRKFKSLSAVARESPARAGTATASSACASASGRRYDADGQRARTAACAAPSTPASRARKGSTWNSTASTPSGGLRGLHRQPEIRGLGRHRERYDDGGFSGGNLDRPGLKQLLTDIEDGLIDVVVVYKIDRLSRSLMDFSKLVEVFDRNGVTFVSVTQSFNTTTSMGRLTLNILLSFAQFEREVIGERIRDKVAASRKRGIWMGGYVPLGYDVQDRKLVVNEAEAATVRRIFERFVELGSATVLARELRREGFRNKQGTLIDKGYLYKLLNNRVYRGRGRAQGQGLSRRA
jgi:DNA invertase Pin-like site-specific DNA recombinase